MLTVMFSPGSIFMSHLFSFWVTVILTVSVLVISVYENLTVILKVPGLDKVTRISL